ncbi:hypothetical protein O3P69_000034 [Scylla paramamosain]|uniref:G-protein coupled receptors family 1 profile domain-containing protein n=1 Tax=Scylla paramamosain TaxID=85552 RepID=A0AAW0UYA2_SCYPA
MAANYTGNYLKCYESGIFGPDVIPPPIGLVTAAAVHIYLVVVLGTLCNGVAIWCVVTCKKTRTAVKVLLCSVFVPLLLICLVTRTMRSEVILALLYCDAERTTSIYRVVTALLYSFLAQMELACIAALAITRTVAVWSTKRHAIKLRVAVTVVISILIYSFFTGVGILGLVFLDYVRSEPLKNFLIIVYFFINVMLPFFVTSIAYALMLFTMRRNKQRLATLESRSSTSGTLDQATRAMIAVFISNLVFGLPHAVYHIRTTFSHTLELSFHMLFYTHFVVDPVVFIWFNNNHRQQVKEKVHAIRKFVLGCNNLACWKSSLPRDSLKKISSTISLWKSSVSVSPNSSSGDAGTIQLDGRVLSHSQV